MLASFAEFMFGTAIVVFQFALFGFLALWLGSRSSMIARIAGGLFVALLAWISAVPVINRLTGYEAQAALDASVLTVAGLVIGWLAGNRMRQQRAGVAVHGKKLNVVGSFIVVASQVFGGLVALVSFLIQLSIITNAGGSSAL